MPVSALDGRAAKGPARPGTGTAGTGIWEDFQALLAANPHAEAVVDDRGRRLTRSGLDALSAGIAADMQAHGLVPGDVVIICMPNWTEWMGVYLAALRIGLVPGTLPVTSDPGSIAYVAGLVGARGVFLPSSHRSRSFEAEISQLAATAPQRLQVMFVDGDHPGQRTWRTVDGAEPGLAEAVAYATARGSLVVSTAGNRDATLSIEEADDDGNRYPAGFPGVVGVAAADAAGVVTDASIHGPHVRLAAPGQLVATSSAAGGDCVYASDSPATSYAAAYVSASAALVAAAHPDETPAQWAYRLEATAVRTDPDRRDDVAGWGVVQPYDAIALVPGSGLRGPVSPFVEGGAALPAEADSAAVWVSAEPGADAQAIRIGVITGIGGLVVLATLGALGVYVARRAEPSEARAAPAGRGMFGDAPEG